MDERIKSSSFRHQTLRPPITQTGALEETAVYDLMQDGHWLKALGALRVFADQTRDAQALSLARIVMAQINRRRAARGVLPIARHLLESVHVDCLPRERLPVYYYEYGYIHQLEGRAKIASELFARSARAADVLDDDYAPLESVIGRAQELAATIIQSSPRGVRSEVVRAHLRAFDDLADRAAQIEGGFAGRWVLNCLLWKANLLLKAGRHRDANRACDEAVEFRSRLDVTSGWIRVGGSTVCGIVGLTRIHSANGPDEIHEALRFIARALVPMLSGNRRRPERVRDSLLGFEQGLTALDRTRHETAIRRIEDVRKRILDGSSFLAPYVAPAR